MKRWYVVLVMLFVLVLPFSTVAASADSANKEKPANANNDHYEIYPLPQDEAYIDTQFSITDEVNVVLEDGVDEATVNFLNEILESKSIKVTHSEEVVSNRTNIIIGTKASNGYVDRYFKDNIEYDSELFNEIDPYVLTIDKELEDQGTIAVLGADTDAAYYGLATLKMIFDQIPGKEVQSVTYEDYADTKWRGFIEGFYGFPWSHESRMSLMEYGGNLKMNSYIFGPKDDKYHNKEWRTLYPEDELAKIEELANVGHETKTQFIWAIHPGFNMINWDDYDNEIDTLLTKLDQLYGVGVRQFGLFMDDISTDQALKDTDKHVKLITDIAEWVADKGDVKSLVYTPPFYNQAWTGESGKPYLEALRDVPENVEIMWTGSGVVGTVNTEDMQWPKDAHGRDPYVWLNWPVNDYKDSRLMLGKGEVLKPGTHNISGVVSNPMVQAELSKIALFAVADFTWNVDDFDDDQSWLDSFKYIAPEVASELNTIAYHLSDPSPSGHGLVVGESENIKNKLNQFLEDFSNDEPIEEVGGLLLVEFDNILNAITAFREKSTNKEMVKEIDPWLNSLSHVVQADKHAVKSALALQSKEMNAAWEGLEGASNAMAESKKFTIEKLNYPDVTVEAGAKRLVPFANELINQLDAQLYTTIDPHAATINPVTSYGSLPDLNNMVDGDNSTFTYIQTIQENGDWYGVDLGKVMPVEEISILQGRNDEDHDIFQKGILEYSKDGKDWTAIGDEQSGYQIDVKNLDLEARYVRYRLTHAGVPGGKPDLWTAIREFTINANQGKESVYTNVEELKDTELKVSEVSAEIADVKNMTLQPSEYLGIALATIEQLAAIELDSTNSDVTLEVSENGVEWEEFTSQNTNTTAAYVRLINKTDQDITFDLTGLLVKLNKFAEPVISHNFGGVYEGEADNVYDGILDSKVWFNGMQDAGKYVQIDMGGLVDVENVAVAINDGEGDYFRKGDLQLSLDGETWKTIHSFNNPEDRSLNFPDHEVPYRYKRVQVDGEQARYVRLISTEDHNVWFALNEIIVNEGDEKPGAENYTIQADPQGEIGYEAKQAIDQKLSTFYTPKGDKKPGKLSYKVSKETQLDEVIVLQSAAAISNAEISLRDTEGWHKVGRLSESLHTIDTAKYEHVLEVKLEWDGSVKPQIYEIIPVKRTETPQAENAADIKSSVEQFEEEGAFKDDESAHALKIHLTAVGQYEKKEATEKVVKHMKSFKLLLDHQREKELISKEAYNALVIDADALIKKWQ